MCQIDGEKKTFTYLEALHLAFCKSELVRSLTTDGAGGSARVPPRPVCCPEHKFHRTSIGPLYIADSGEIALSASLALDMVEQEMERGDLQMCWVMPRSEEAICPWWRLHERTGGAEACWQAALYDFGCL